MYGIPPILVDGARLSSTMETPRLRTMLQQAITSDADTVLTGTQSTAALRRASVRRTLTSRLSQQQGSSVIPVYETVSLPSDALMGLAEAYHATTNKGLPFRLLCGRLLLTASAWAQRSPTLLVVQRPLSSPLQKRKILPSVQHRDSSHSPADDAQTVLQRKRSVTDVPNR